MKKPMTGHEYANLIADYVYRNFSDRGIKVYREVNIGKSIIGKNRRIDMLLLSEDQQAAFAIECKYQDSAGTADEKIPYALNNMKALPMAGCIVYAGIGFSVGVLHMLQASEIAAYCLPDATTFHATKDTKELDHLLAIHFRWWDVIVAGKKPWQPRPSTPMVVESPASAIDQINQTELL
ncbi:MAG: PD-(D/E)XK nuclease superfamily protein [Synechococcales bacterium]|nr:PD-(D/E)XK nuclease superfamily protein [Synechococcales bacterium]